MIPDNELQAFLTKKSHARYLIRFLNLMPSQLQSQDSVRVTIAYFALSGLDVLNSLDQLPEARKKSTIEWLYSLQIVPKPTDPIETWKNCGFQGSSILNIENEQSEDFQGYKFGHIAMTYTALASLVILGDDLSRVNKPAIIEGLKALQQTDGSFSATLAGSENDMRFVYCASCISYILQDWSGINLPMSIDYITKSISYDGGIAQGPGLESHGGTTYCAVAALVLMGQLKTSLTEQQLSQLRRWTIMRQMSGFQGRPNKPVDTCYSFWIGSTLEMLGIFEMVNFEENKDYILSTQDPITGGFSKWVDTTPDPLHTYLGLCGLSLMKEPELLPVSPALNITERAMAHLKELHRRWET